MSLPITSGSGCNSLVYANAIYRCIKTKGKWDSVSCSCVYNSLTSTATAIISLTSTATGTVVSVTQIAINDCINAGGKWNYSTGICQFTQPTVTFTSTSTSTTTSTKSSTSTSTSRCYSPQVLINECNNSGGTWNYSNCICKYASSTVTSSATSSNTSSVSFLSETIFGIPVVLLILLAMILIVGFMGLKK